MIVWRVLGVTIIRASMKVWLVLEVVLAEVEAGAEVEARTRFQDGETTGAARLVAEAIAVVLAGMTGHHQHVNVPRCAVSISP